MNNTTGPIDFPRRIPFVEHLGFELWSLGQGTAELRLVVQDHQMNSMLVAHGGVVMTLLDVAMAHAARSVAPPLSASVSSAAAVASEAGRDAALQAQGVVTIEMKTSFMRASHGRLRAVGTLLHRTATMGFCEGSVFDADGTLCAHATGTFKYVRGVAGHAAREAVAAAALDAREEAQEVIQQAAQPAALATPAAAADTPGASAAPDPRPPTATQDAAP